MHVKNLRSSRVGADNFRVKLLILIPLKIKICIMIVVSWQERLCLNKRWKCYSLCLGNFELGRRYVNICFLTPAKLRSGDYSFKYSLLRPGEVQKWGLFIQIFASSPRHSSEEGTIHSNICFLAPVKLRSGDYSFKYLLSCPGEAQKWGLFIQIFAFSPRYDLEVDSIHSLIGIFKYI